MSDYIKDIIFNTIELIKIPSVESQPEQDSPFGDGVKKALNYVLKLSENLGMRVFNINNYIGFSEVGVGNEMIGIACHVDVVPVDENKWSFPPFQGVVVDDKIYGRGALDDKGPTIAAIFALRKLMDDMDKINKRIRIIFSCDEESGWQDIKFYKDRERDPDFVIVPDAMFPVINAEKGIIHLKIVIKNPYKWLIDIKGGEHVNVVPSECKVVFSNQIKDIINLKDNEEPVRVFKGKSAHASMPEKGENAILKALFFISEIEEEIENNNFFKNIISVLDTSKNKELQLSDYSGNLTLNLGKIEIENNNLNIYIDIRYPVTYLKEDILSRIKRDFEDLYLIDYHAPLYVSIDDKYIKSLENVFTSYTGKEFKPISIGGGTLARAFKKAVAFGPLLDINDNVAHREDEYIKIESLIDTYNIYYLSLKEMLNI
ncbi:MAG TPA: Sapep family Mn(2+)-dependent dipeptidase [Spirochaetota bacterium]|nr:Sapep family Mn(2+)-dependent dipeptidase [Spirochaetota bacterium]HOM38526.1 Sapep family Mn(2+)-dependent dipeptidase [Spirochaetota bacterium]HPQ49066.1 Sapep family Mn(2+)-dependent dipeptidase [Spirochaetota bacterium]